jgi:hypothetical protein
VLKKVLWEVFRVMMQRSQCLDEVNVCHYYCLTDECDSKNFNCKKDPFCNTYQDTGVQCTCERELCNEISCDREFHIITKGWLK